MDRSINNEHIKRNAEKFDSFTKRLYVTKKPEMPDSERIMLMNVDIDLAALIDAYSKLNDFDNTQSQKMLGKISALESDLINANMNLEHITAELERVSKEWDAAASEARCRKPTDCFYKRDQQREEGERDG